MTNCKYGAKAWETPISCEWVKAGIEPPCSDCSWSPDLRMALAALMKSQEEQVKAGGEED